MKKKNIFSETRNLNPNCTTWLIIGLSLIRFFCFLFVMWIRNKPRTSKTWWEQYFRIIVYHLTIKTTNMAQIVLRWHSIKGLSFFVYWKCKKSTHERQSFSIGLWGKLINIFFSEIMELIESKPYMNNRWMVLNTKFCVNWKSKMTATAGKIQHRYLWEKYFKIILIRNVWTIWQ